MMNRNRWEREQATQPIPIAAIKKETAQERYQRLKRTADLTGKRFLFVYLEDQKRQVHAKNEPH